MNQAKTFLMVVLTIIFVALGSLIGGQDGAMIAFYCPCHELRELLVLR